jgi:ubiquitin conjugation factor E4 B
VDVNYFRTIPVGRKTPRVVLTEETKLKADNNVAEEYLAHTVKDVDPHFISEIFFLNSYAHSVGMGPAMQTHQRLEGDITDMQRQVDRINATNNWRQSPHAALYSAALERTKKQIEEAASLEATMDAVMYDRLSQEKSLDFLGFVANWLLRLADERHQHPAKPISLPLREDVPIEWRCLPQFLFEIITDHLLYVMRYSLFLLILMKGRLISLVIDQGQN